MNSSPRRYSTCTLGMNAKFYSKIIEGQKSSTIRMGYVFFTSEILSLDFGFTKLEVPLKKVEYHKTFDDLTETDSVRDGFKDLRELQKELRKFYPNIRADSPVTIVHFELQKNMISEKT